MTINDYRPSFFRFGDGRAFAGWQTRGGDFWGDDTTKDTVVNHLKGSELKLLACEIGLSVPNDFGMYLMKHAVPALETGERLVFVKDVDLAPLIYIEAGERCVAVRWCKASGTVELFMQNYHKRLDDDSNCLVLEPNHSDDVIAALRVLRGEPSKHYMENATTVAA